MSDPLQDPTGNDTPLDYFNPDTGGAVPPNAADFQARPEQSGGSGVESKGFNFRPFEPDKPLQTENTTELGRQQSQAEAEDAKRAEEVRKEIAVEASKVRFDTSNMPQDRVDASSTDTQTSQQQQDKGKGLLGRFFGGRRGEPPPQQDQSVAPGTSGVRRLVNDVSEGVKAKEEAKQKREADKQREVARIKNDITGAMAAIWVDTAGDTVRFQSAVDRLGSLGFSSEQSALTRAYAQGVGRPENVNFLDTGSRDAFQAKVMMLGGVRRAYDRLDAKRASGSLSAEDAKLLGEYGKMWNAAVSENNWEPTIDRYKAVVQSQIDKGLPPEGNDDFALRMDLLSKVDFDAARQLAEAFVAKGGKKDAVGEIWARKTLLEAYDYGSYDTDPAMKEMFEARLKKAQEQAASEGKPFDEAAYRKTNIDAVVERSKVVVKLAREKGDWGPLEDFVVKDITERFFKQPNWDREKGRAMIRGMEWSNPDKATQLAQAFVANGGDRALVEKYLPKRQPQKDTSRITPYQPRERSQDVSPFGW
jgi:hypothetical protein